MADDLDFGATLKGFRAGQLMFNRYTLERILGRGGMGVVWLAHDEDLGRDIALKFLPEVVSADKQAVEDLKRETRRSLELTHPHIIRIHDFVQDGHITAISMEYVGGDTLASLKVDQPEGYFEVKDISGWVAQYCEALAYAHERAKIVHRDLKPANLMIDSRGDAKIADFGIAASVSDSVSRVSAQTGSSGTPVYMSLQQMMGEKPAVTDDVYALGATLYELLTGRPPFHSGNIVLQVQSKTPPSMAERRIELERKGEAIPASWEETVAACLSKDPASRPSSVKQVWERLNGAGIQGLDSSREGSGPHEIELNECDKNLKPVPPGTDASEHGTTEIDSGPKKGAKRRGQLVVGTVILMLIGAGWWFGMEQPRQQQVAAERVAAELAKEARLALEQAEAESARIEMDRLAEEAEVSRLELQRAADLATAEVAAELRSRFPSRYFRVDESSAEVILRGLEDSFQVPSGALTQEALDYQEFSFEQAFTLLSDAEREKWSDKFSENRRAFFGKLKNREMDLVTLESLFLKLKHAYGVVGEARAGARAAIPELERDFMERWGNLFPDNESRAIASVIVSRDNLKSQIAWADEDPAVGAFGVLNAPAGRAAIQVVDEDGSSNVHELILPRATLLVIDEQGTEIARSELKKP